MLPPDLLQVCSSIARELRHKALKKKKTLPALFWESQKKGLDGPTLADSCVRSMSRWPQQQ